MAKALSAIAAFLLIPLALTACGCGPGSAGGEAAAAGAAAGDPARAKWPDSSPSGPPSAPTNPPSSPALTDMAVHLKGESPRPRASMTSTGPPVSSSDGVGPIGETAKATGEADASQGLPPQAERSEKEKMIITVGDVTLTAIMADNSSAEALMTLLRGKPLTIKMHDYGGFEKVGPIGQTLPRNDEPTNATAGDLILYQGGSFVIYYGENSWNLTRLGRIVDADAAELRKLLGRGGVTVTLSANADEP